KIIMGTGRSAGAWIISSRDGNNFVIEESNGIDDTSNSEIVPAHQQYNGFLYIWTSNNNGTEIWRTDNGSSWSQLLVNGNSNGLDGTADNIKITGEMISGSPGNSILAAGPLFVGTENKTTGCEIWTYNGTTWTKDADAGTDLSSCTNENKTASGAFFNERLYIGTFHDDCPTMAGGLYYSASPWTVVTSSGFNDLNNVQLYPSYKSYNDYLYVGTLNYSGAQIWRSLSGNPYPADWEKVVDFSTITINGSQSNPQDPNNWEASSFSIPGDGYLYVALSNDLTGAEVWRTDGTVWEQVNEDGFYTGDGQYNSSVFLSRTAFRGNLFAGTARKPVYGGAQLWKVKVVPYDDSNPHMVDKEGDIIIIGSSERKGIVNPDKGDVAEIQFRGSQYGRYELRIYTLLGELLYDDSKESDADGRFYWIPEDIASGIYIVHIEGPGINTHEKAAILR
ncbi:hypothetical protein ACFLTD_04100, partial [Elusimicrobiota bacterium]